MNDLRKLVIAQFWVIIAMAPFALWAFIEWIMWFANKFVWQEV